MKGLFLLAGYLVLAGTATVQAQRTAHQAAVNAIFPDMKGEAVLTLDKQDTGKIWSLADGRLLYKMHRKSPDWAVKMLRYKVAHPSLMQPGFGYDVEDLFAKDSNWMVYKLNGEVIGRLRQKARTVPWQHWNKATGKISYCILVNGVAQLSLIDTKEPTGDNKRVVLHPLAEFPATYPRPDFSPKGAWLVCPYTGVLVRTATGQIVNIDKAASGAEFYPSELAFNADETAVALANRKQQKMFVIETATGRLLREYSVPASIRQDDGYYVTPCADGKSFVYSGNVYRKPGMKGDEKAAWIVTDGVARSLVD